MTANKLATYGSILLAGIALWSLAAPKVKAALGKAASDQAARSRDLAAHQSVLTEQWGSLASVAASTLPTSITGGF